MATNLATSALELRSWLQAVAKISASVNNLDPIGAVLNAIAETTCELLNYDFGAVLLPDEANDRLLIRGYYGLSSSYVAMVNTRKPVRLGHGAYGEGPSSRAFRNQQIAVIRDYLKDPAAVPWAGVAVEQGYRTLASVPLIVSGASIGTLNCYTRAIHDFSSDEILLLETIGNQAAIAIEAARLREREHDTISRLEQAGRTLEAQARLLQRTEEIHSQLTDLILQGAGLGGIAATLARVLGGAVLIRDTEGLPLAGGTSDEESSVPAEPEAEMRDIGRFLASLVSERQPREIAAGDHPAIQERAFVAPVVIGPDVVAHLTVLKPWSQLGPLESRALEHGATVVALEMLKQRIASEVEGRLRGELLSDLLSGRPADPLVLRARANQLDHDLRAPHAAIVISVDVSPQDRASPHPPTEYVSRLASVIGVAGRRMRLQAIVGEQDGFTVALVGVPDDRRSMSCVELADAIRRDARRALNGRTVSVAVGPLVRQPAEFIRSYQVARGACELNRQFGEVDRTITLDQLGVYGLLLSVGRLDELVTFSHATLSPLRFYDQRRGSELLPTLRSFLAHSCRTTDTADALVVHPNTVAYRVRRIESLLSTDLTKPDALLRLQLALVVDDIVSSRAADPQDASPDERLGARSRQPE